MNAFWCIALVLTCVSASVWGYEGNPGDWGYKKEEDLRVKVLSPTEWKDYYPLCDGQSQSPIDLSSTKAQYDAKLSPFNIPTFQLVNDGHLIRVNLERFGMPYPSISGGGLVGTYITDLVVIHWGVSMFDGPKDALNGSEHTVDGNTYPLEIQFVHHSSKYKNLMEATGKPDGIAILAVFVEVADDLNRPFQKILNLMRNVKNKGDRVNLPHFFIRDLLPSDLASFWRYSGSITVPPCDESVSWTIFKNPIQISRYQFTDLKEQQPMSNTFRPIQPLNGRTVYSSDQD